MPRLSCILCSRNDQYMGNARWRLETALNYLGGQAEALGLGPDTVEVLVTDWGSRTPLAEVVRLTPAAHRLTRFLHVPPEVAGPLQGDSPFPEVLALNLAARRAAGAYIGRIDQDTLVGRRTLEWCCGPAMPDPAALYFANRRDLPYRLTSASPSLGAVTRFVEERGARMPVHRQNPFTGHVFWTSSVGIWLASREVWDEAGGYDERLRYYNWMETDMIHRLRPQHRIVDLGALTDWDCYHLEHYHPLRSWASRPHTRKNADIDLAVPAPAIRPSGPDWGLTHLDIRATPAVRPAVASTPPRTAAFGATMARLQVMRAVDAVGATGQAGLHRLAERSARLVSALPWNAPWQWPRLAWRLWRGRAAAPAAGYAGWPWGPLRDLGARLLARAGLLRLVRRWRVALRLRRQPAWRRAAGEAGRLPAFQASHGHVFAPDGPARTRQALVISSRCPNVRCELAVIAAIQDAGFRVTLLLEDEQRPLAGYYRLAGADVRLWSGFLPRGHHGPAARRALAGAVSLTDAMALTHAGIRTGRIAACTTLRDLQVGELDLTDRPGRAVLTRRLAASLGAVEQATAILDSLTPELVVTDHEYTPKGELFESALARGCDVVAYDAAHRTDALVFKRYHAGNRDRHLTTLAPGTWAALRSRPWDPADRAAVDTEIRDCYARGDWYLSGTRHGPSTPSAVAAALGLDRRKKTAVVFPHVLWDAPVMWGDPLFPSYQDWFVRTVRIAYESPALNWLVKLHPSHAWRGTADGSGVPAEVRVLDQLGPRPAHVTLVPADTPVATDALLRTVDYCLTVRGTVGVEAARLGLPVLTAGRARYTHHGFTLDSGTPDEYLDRVRHLEDLPPLPEAARELADRFAYGAFLLRPWRMTSIVPRGDDCAVNVTDRAALGHAADIRALAAWFASDDEDYLSAPAPV